MDGFDPALSRARSLGRTPEEHVALERMLAVRRARRRQGGGAVLSRVRGPTLSMPPPPPSLPPHQLHSSPSASRPRRQEADPATPAPVHAAGDSVADIRAELLRPWGYTGRPRRRPRQCKGAGWHKRGYRSVGQMWINTELSGCIKGHDYSQEMTLGDFVRTIQSKDVVIFSLHSIPFRPFPIFWAFVDCLETFLARNAWHHQRLHVLNLSW